MRRIAGWRERPGVCIREKNIRSIISTSCRPKLGSLRTKKNVSFPRIESGIPSACMMQHLCASPKSSAVSEWEDSIRRVFQFRCRPLITAMSSTADASKLTGCVPAIELRVTISKDFLCSFLWLQRKEDVLKICLPAPYFSFRERK